MADAADRPAGALVRLARLRVPLGFAVGALAFWLARPTWTTLAAGSLIALAGETLRFWAAGHLEKGREVSSSGPYRWVAHPLYVGSTVMGIGFVVAAGRPLVGVLVLGYLAMAVTAAVRTEEAALRARFGDTYEAYRRGQLAAPRPFSIARAVRNREPRTVVGLLVLIALLALRAGSG